VKILFAHNRYQNLGGEDLAANAEMDLVARHGHTIELFEADNAEIVGLAGKAKTALGTIYSTSAKQAFEARIQSFKPDLVHIFNFFPLLSPSIHYACQEVGVPVVQKISNFRLICPGGLLLREGRICEDCVGRKIPWPGVLHACYRGSRLATTAVTAMLATHHLLGTWKNLISAYIARTNFGREKLVEGGLPATKIAIIPCFAADTGRPTYGNRRLALFAGRLSAEKGITTLLSAWDRLDGSTPMLKVAGDGPLKEEVTRRSDGERIDYLGALSRREVQTLMREAAFLIFPSVGYETFGLTIIEAFACGVPVFASRMGAMAEIVRDGDTGLHFTPGDPEDLAAKVEWACMHPKQMEAMGRNARAEYLAKYTPERNYELLIELYDRAIAAP
jgi:glycosyltransferase involved in cell wall biosynthesis